MTPRIIQTYLSARPHKIKEALFNMFSTANVPLYVYVCYSGEKVDIEENENIKVEYLGLTDPPDMNVNKLVHYSMQQAILHFKTQDNDLLGLWSDDFEGHMDWGKNLLKAYNDNPEKDLIAINECNYHTDYTHSLWYHSPIFFMSKKYLYDINDGYFISRFYSRFFSDSDNSQISMLLGRHQFVQDSIIRHIHYTAGSREKDQLDNNASQFIERDYDIYRSRRSLLLNLLPDQKFSTWKTNWKNTELASQILNTIQIINASNIIEIGTSVGYITKYFAKLLPELPITTIEVSPYFVQDAKEELANFKNITLIHGFSASFGECYSKLIKAEKTISRYLRYNNLGTNRTNVLKELLEKSERPFLIFNSSLTTELEIEKVIAHCDKHKKPFGFIIVNNVANPYLADRVMGTYLGDGVRISWKTNET